jgi:hypothetical protein
MATVMTFQSIEAWNEFIDSVGKDGTVVVGSTRFRIGLQEWRMTTGHSGDRSLAWSHLLKMGLTDKIEHLFEKHPDGAALFVADARTGQVTRIGWTDEPENLRQRRVRRFRELARHGGHQAHHAPHGGHHAHHSHHGGRARGKVKVAPKADDHYGVGSLATDIAYYAILGPVLPVWWVLKKVENAIDRPKPVGDRVHF